LEKSSVFKEFSHRKIPVRHAGRDRLEIYFGKPEFTMSFELFFKSLEKFVKKAKN